MKIRSAMNMKRTPERGRSVFCGSPWVTLLSIGMLAILSLTGCAENSRNAAAEDKPEFQVIDPEKKDAVILQVGETSYSNADFYSILESTAGDELPDLGALALSRLYDDFVEEKILLEASQASDIKLTDEEAANYILKLRAGSSGNPQSDPMSAQDRKSLMERLLIEKYSLSIINGVDVSDEEIQAYYEENKRDFLRSERVKVSQILLPSEDQAVALYEELKSADEDVFKRTAREKSQGVEADRGGEMGIFELGQLPFEMEKVIFSLQEGEVSRVVESAYGYHLFRLDKRYDAELQSADDAVPLIRALLIEAKVKDVLSRHVNDLKNKMDWKSYTQNLSFPYQRNIDE